MTNRGTKTVGKVAAGLVLAMLAPSAGAVAQLNPVKWSLSVAPGSTTVRPGDTGRATVTATMDEGWHLYAVTQGPPPIATRVRLGKDQPFRLTGSVDAPVPEPGFDENFGIEVEYYGGVAPFGLTFEVDREAVSGRQPIVAEAYFQACNDRMCLPPQTVRPQAVIEIVGGKAPGPGAPPVATGGLATPPAPAAPPAAGRSDTGGAGPGVATRVPGPDAGLDRSPATSVFAPPESRAATPADAASLSPPAAPANQAATPSGAGGAAEAGGGAAAVVEFGSGTTSPASAARPQSFMSFVWLAMTMGALALLTPCVFPMVPITVSYFTKRAAGGRAAAIGRAATYAAAIILTFTVLGLLIALLFGAASLNRFAASPWLNLTVTAIFVVFALNLFGAFELQLPSGLLSRLDGLTRRQGGNDVVGTLLMGLTFTLTSFTCTVPFIGTLLVMASQGEWEWPLVGMLAYSTVFAAPFFVLALAPQLVAQLPRSGAWMHAVKVVMGFLVMAAAMKFISNVDLVWGWGIFTREFVLAAWVGVAGLAALYLLGLVRLSEDGENGGTARVGAGRLLTALVFLTLAVWMLTGAFGRRLGELEAFLPPATAASSAGGPSGAAAGELSWMVNDYDGALAEASRSGRRVVIDFTGYTCTNCHWMEANMLPRAEVRRELERYVRVRLYTDGQGEVYRRQQAFQQETFGTIALPYYAIVEADGRPVATFSGLTRDPAEFVRFLQSGAGSGI